MYTPMMNKFVIDHEWMVSSLQNLDLTSVISLVDRRYVRRIVFCFMRCLLSNINNYIECYA